VGFVVDKVALGQVFSEYFGFPCQSPFHQFLHKSPSPIIRGWYNRPVVAAVPKVPPHTLKKKETKKQGNMSMPYLTRLVPGFPPWWYGFYLRSGHVGFVVDEGKLGQSFSEYFGFL
jgi:hypothetical protein